MRLTDTQTCRQMQSLREKQQYGSACRLNIWTHSCSVSDATWKSTHTLRSEGKPLSSNMHIIFTCVGGIKALVCVI